MSIVILTFALSLASSAFSAPLSPSSSRAYFTARIGIQNDNILTSKPVNPANTYIVAGRQANATCNPTQPGCNQGNEPGVYYIANGNLFLGSTHGRQIVYIDPKVGQLRFNHVDAEVPPGAVIDGWERDENGSVKHGDDPIWACQSGEGKGYNIIVELESVGVSPEACGGTPANVASQPASGPAAYQYM